MQENNKSIILIGAKLILVMKGILTSMTQRILLLLPLFSAKLNLTFYAYDKHRFTYVKTFDILIADFIAQLKARL